MRLVSGTAGAAILLILLLASSHALSGSAVGVPGGEHAADGGNGEQFAVLVFTRTAGFRHDSIEPGVEAIRKLGAQHGFDVEHTEDEDYFTPDNLDRYSAVVFLNTTGNILNEQERRAFEGFIRAGNGFVGVHAAADTGYDWPWYGRLVGAYFKSHPHIQNATVIVEDPSDPSTRYLPARWERRDEWYNFRENPRENVHVLLRLDTETFEGGAMGDDHPIAWRHEFGGGRAWYTGGGHTRESFAEPLFLGHLLGGIRWAAGRADESPGAP